jgi:hypothetical protein
MAIAKYTGKEPGAGNGGSPRFHFNEVLATNMAIEILNKSGSKA